MSQLPNTNDATEEWHLNEHSAWSELAPVLDFDSSSDALIEPSETQPPVDAPVAAVACFFHEAIEAFTSATSTRRIMDLPSRQPLWEIEHRGQRLGLFYPGMGASLASCTMERVIAAGCRVIVACGAAGALTPEVELAHHIVAVTSAIRDEGTSYHYLSPSERIVAAPGVIESMCETLRQRQMPYLTGRTWTTDALFRETRSRVAKRRQEGCLTVEMESSALFAVASFRQVRYGQFLYAHDDLSGEAWAECEWDEAVPIRQMLVGIAADAALSIAENSIARCDSAAM